MDFFDDDDGSMPPPPPPPADDEVDFNDIVSESGSVNEESMREAASTRRSATGSTSSARRRKRRRSSASSSSRPLTAAVGGAYRERISEDPAPLFSIGEGGGGGRAEGSAARSAAGRVTAAEADFARAALRGANIPEEQMGAALAAALDDQSFDRNYAVRPDFLYDTDACPICEEVLTFLNKDSELRLAEGHNNITHNARIRRAEVAQSVQSRTAIGKDSTHYQLIYKFEATMKTRIKDSRLVALVLRLRANLIEKELEKNRMKYVRWTRALYEKHIDEKNDHTWDPAREAMADHKEMRAVMRRIKEAIFVPSLTQPGAMLLDSRASEQYLKYTLAQQKTRVHVKQEQAEVDPNSAATLRAITVAINNVVTDSAADSVTCDPASSAGLVAADDMSAYDINGL